MAAFQKKVMSMYDRLKDASYWTEINADKTENDLHLELLKTVDEIIKNVEHKQLTKLW